MRVWRRFEKISGRKVIKQGVLARVKEKKTLLLTKILDSSLDEKTAFIVKCCGGDCWWKKEERTLIVPVSGWHTCEKKLCFVEKNSWRQEAMESQWHVEICPCGTTPRTIEFGYYTPLSCQLLINQKLIRWYIVSRIEYKEVVFWSQSIKKIWYS